MYQLVSTEVPDVVRLIWTVGTPEAFFFKLEQWLHRGHERPTWKETRYQTRLNENLLFDAAPISACLVESTDVTTTPSTRWRKLVSCKFLCVEVIKVRHGMDITDWCGWVYQSDCEMNVFVFYWLQSIIPATMIRRISIPNSIADAGVLLRGWPTLLNGVLWKSWNVSSVPRSRPIGISSTWMPQEVKENTDRTFQSKTSFIRFSR